MVLSGIGLGTLFYLVFVVSRGCGESSSGSKHTPLL